MQEPQQPGKILRWREEAQERIAYLAQQEKQALVDIDTLPVGSHVRTAHWSFIKELGYRKNELQDLLKKVPAENLSAPASPVGEKPETLKEHAVLLIEWAYNREPIEGDSAEDIYNEFLNRNKTEDNA